MTDIHCHILPGIDDGARTLEDALQMARIAQRSGVNAIIATPHCNHPANFKSNYIDRELADHFALLHAAIKEARIPISLYPGAEVLCSEDTPQLLEAGKLLTLAGSRYLLVEFFFNESPSFMNRQLDAIAALGAVPVIAHPERYSAIQQDPRITESWFSRGYILQLNKGSILGALGVRAQSCSHFLLTQGLAHVIASDAHGIRQRTTNMQPLEEVLPSLCPESYADILLRRNPRRICKDKPVIEA